MRKIKVFLGMPKFSAEMLYFSLSLSLSLKAFLAGDRVDILEMNEYSCSELHSIIACVLWH